MSEVSEPSLTLREFCVMNRIPFQSVSFYGHRKDEQRLVLGLDKRLTEIAGDFDELTIQPDRNINYSGILLKEIATSKKENAATEYTFQSDTNEKKLIHSELTQQECQDYTAKEVGRFIDELPDFDENSKIVLGISGGGDSNTLIRSFLAHPKVRKENLVAVMMLGIPDWDLGRPRAEALCQNYGIELRFVESDDVAKLLRKKSMDWVTDFEKVFPDADIEAVGTLGIRLSLMKVAQEVSAQAIVLGLNLEDLLSESLLCLLTGKLPSPFPVRSIDGSKIWYPLFRVPKKILDGCYPKYSKQNSQERYPSMMMGRAIPYYAAQMMHQISPGIEFDLISGLQKISEMNSAHSHYDAELGFSTTEPLPLDIRAKWKKFVEL